MAWLGVGTFPKFSRSSMIGRVIFSFISYGVGVVLHAFVVIFTETVKNSMCIFFLKIIYCSLNF